MTLSEFLKHYLIVESENDYLIDASNRDEDEMQEWIDDYICSELDADEINWMENYDIKDLEELLKDDDYYWAAIIVKGALQSNFRRNPQEDYYINDGGKLHVVVPLKYLK